MGTAHSKGVNRAPNNFNEVMIFYFFVHFSLVFLALVGCLADSASWRRCKLYVNTRRCWCESQTIIQQKMQKKKKTEQVIVSGTFSGLKVLWKLISSRKYRTQRTNRGYTMWGRRNFAELSAAENAYHARSVLSFCCWHMHAAQLSLWTLSSSVQSVGAAWLDLIHSIKG